LIVLTADKDAEYGIRSLLENRRSALLIREIDFQCVVHPRHDAGVRLRCAEFLRAFLRTHKRTLVIFDKEGCGDESRSAEQIERSTEELLSANGWGDRCAAIVLVPELESWIWDGGVSARKAAGLATAQEAKSLLMQAGFLAPGQIKPARPKEAFEALLRAARTKRSASLFSDMARDVDMAKCTDSAFQKFARTLQTWFPRE